MYVTQNGAVYGTAQGSHVWLMKFTDHAAWMWSKETRTHDMVETGWKAWRHGCDEHLVPPKCPCTWLAFNIHVSDSLAIGRLRKSVLLESQGQDIAKVWNDLSKTTLKARGTHPVQTADPGWAGEENRLQNATPPSGSHNTNSWGAFISFQSHWTSASTPQIYPGGFYFAVIHWIP